MYHGTLHIFEFYKKDFGCSFQFLLAITSDKRANNHKSQLVTFSLTFSNEDGDTTEKQTRNTSV